jgi:pentapeptide MXKDX repeat protein
MVKLFSMPRNKGLSGPVPYDSDLKSLFETGPDLPKGNSSMTISTRVALGISAAALSLSLALTPVAFAQDAMKKDDGMKKDTMSKDSMKKDTMSKDSMKKDDGMTKKDDGMMKKDGMSK